MIICVPLCSYINLHPTVLLKFPEVYLNQIMVSAGTFTPTLPAISRNLTASNPQTHASLNVTGALTYESSSQQWHLAFLYIWQVQPVALNFLPHHSHSHLQYGCHIYSNLSSGSSLEPWSYEAAMLPAVPPCYPN